VSNLTVWDDERIKLLRDTYAKQLNEGQFGVFLELCKSQGLNPFNREVYAMVIGGKLVQITGIHGLLKIAARSGAYAGMDDVTYVEKDGKLLSATATCYKLVQGHRVPFTATVDFKEYTTGKGNWKDMPKTMLAKVARAHALRLGFPEVGAMYSEEEVGAMRSSGPAQSERAKEWTENLKEAKAPDVPEYIELDPEDSFEEEVTQ
jgi:phage recombination protein Bet